MHGPAASPVKIALVAAAWAAGALALGVSGQLEPLPRPVLQIILFGLVGVLLAWSFATPGGRRTAAAVPLRGLVAIHLVRFVGFYFLWLHARGRLPYDFAVPGGIGDIAVAVLAGVLILADPRRPTLRPVLMLWSAIGLADILFVVATAARLALSDRASMVELTHLPLSLLPTLVVPLIIWSHIIILWRLRRLPAF